MTPDVVRDWRDNNGLAAKVPSEVAKGNQALTLRGSNPETTPTNENPGALAGASGAGQNSTNFVSVGYRNRVEAATTLCMAIANAHPDDARLLLTAALIDLAAGTPPHTPFGDIREDAAWWADMATPAELLEYMAAALRALGRQALCLTHRKQLLVAMYQSLPAKDREAFLGRVDPNGNFRKTGAT